MTCVNKLISAVAGVVLCAAAVFAASPVFTATQEITSNNDFSLAGHGDTTWVITDRGCNCAYTLGDSLAWFGYKADYFNGTLAFGNAHVLAGLSEAPSTRNAYQVDEGRLWLYDHAPKSYILVNPEFSASVSLDSLKRNADFSIHDIAWSPGAFWVAAGDGQLVRISTTDTSKIAYLTGTKTACPSVSFVDSIIAKYGRLPDTSRSVIAVEVQDTSSAHPVVWLATPARIYSFSPIDTTWDSLSTTLSDTSRLFVHFNNVFAAPGSGTGKVYASVVTRVSSTSPPDTFLFRYSTARNAWIRCTDNVPAAVAFGDSSSVYVVAGNQVRMYKDAADSLILNIDKSIFTRRMTKASGGIYPGYVNDILFLPQNNDSAHLWIASSSKDNPAENGLFVSFSERTDEQNDSAFTYVHRDAKLTGALKQSYAYPGILTDNTPKAVFAYNLSKASKVTICVYDWNMDPVKVVIKNAQRPAGTEQANGRSTKADEDKWDGTNSAGQRVAVGVYYYKITAQSGEHAFGKIIVAKSK